MSDPKIPEFKCDTVKASDGTDRYEFVCPTCGLKRTHGASDGFRMSHCRSPNLRETKNGDWVVDPDCWPSGYVLKGE